MATKGTKTENIKTQVDNLIESAQHTATRGWQGHEREVYTMQGAGTFTAEYEITSGWTREQMEEELRRRARRIAARRMLPKGMDDRSNRLQRAMAFIGEHREMIPFLTWVYSHTKHGRSVESAVSEYKKKYGQPQFVTREYSYYSKDGRWSFAPKGIYESELVAKVPYLPKAWRCA